MDNFEITCGAVFSLMNGGNPPLLLDCREKLEWELVRLDGAMWVPMQEIPARLSEILTSCAGRELVVYCHHGVRSLHVVHFLRGQGIENCLSMRGGIEEWAVLVDSSLPRY